MSKKLSRIYTYKHRGYVLMQTSFNWHYMIFDENTGEWVVHAQCAVKLDEDEAKRRIDEYLARGT